MSKKKGTKRKVVVGNKEGAKGNARTVATSKTKVAPTTSRRRAGASRTTKEPLLFGKQNYIMVLAGIGLVALGLIAMLGGGQPDPNTWDPDIIYSKRITVLGPFLILSGLAVEIYAIFKR